MKATMSLHFNMYISKLCEKPKHIFMGREKGHFNLTGAFQMSTLF